MATTSLSLCPAVGTVSPRSHVELSILIDHQESGCRAVPHPVCHPELVQPGHQLAGGMLLECWAGNPQGRRSTRQILTPGIDFFVSVVARGVHRESLRSHPAPDRAVHLRGRFPRGRWDRRAVHGVIISGARMRGEQWPGHSLPPPLLGERQDGAGREARQESPNGSLELFSSERHAERG
jgi:hypothetical protein